MRKIFLLFFLFFQFSFLSAQTSLKGIALENGPYSVGFRHYTKADSSRSYSRDFDFSNQILPRPISISVWYPSKRQTQESQPLQVLDYLEILKEEEEWEYLPNEQILNWFEYRNTPSNRQHLTEKTTAFLDGEFGEGKSPVILYAPSFQASSIENFALFEFLASHGFVVFSSSSRGTESRSFSNNLPKEMETQARDLEFLLSEAFQFPLSDLDHIALMGFSFGGLASIITQSRNEWIKAVVSLDGTERYQYNLLSQSPFFDPAKLDVPYLHMAQKDIPEQVLKEDHLDPSLNTEFQFFDSLNNNKAYQLKFHHLTHSHFSTLGVLFSDRDLRQDKSDVEIMTSYRLMSNYILNFLKANLSKDSLAISFLDTNWQSDGMNHLISQQVKTPTKRSFRFQDFNELAKNQNYEKLEPLLDSIQSVHPKFILPESHLNTLGLQLAFNPSMGNQGIRIFLLAIKLYPNSANLYDSLGEAYLFLGEKENALESFKRSLELYPENQNALMRIEQLEQKR